MTTRQSPPETTAAATTPTRERFYWERRRVGALPWVLGGVGLLGIGLVHDIPIRHSIEGSLEARSRAALDASGAVAVDVRFTGRDGVLTGSLPAGTPADALVAELEALDGVRVVRADFGGADQTGATDAPPAAGSPTISAGEAPPSGQASAGPQAEPSISVAATSGQLPSVTLATAGGTATLTGAVPSQEAIDALVAAATARYGQGKVVNQLTVDDTLSTRGLVEFGRLIGTPGTGETVNAALSQGRLALRGTVSSAAVKAALEQAAIAVTGDASRVSSQLTVGAGSASQAGSGPTARVQAELRRLRTITFRTGSTTPTSSGMRTVRQVAQLLKDNPQTKVRIQGHTDNVGSAATNQWLSTQRARAVREALHNLGIDHDRMSFIGYGQTRPLVPNTSAANRAKNRRVEFLVL